MTSVFQTYSEPALGAGYGFPGFEIRTKEPSKAVASSPRSVDPGRWVYVWPQYSNRLRLVDFKCIHRGNGDDAVTVGLDPSELVAEVDSRGEPYGAYFVKIKPNGDTICAATSLVLSQPKVTFEAVPGAGVTGVNVSIIGGLRKGQPNSLTLTPAGAGVPVISEAVKLKREAYTTFRVTRTTDASFQATPGERIRARCYHNDRFLIGWIGASGNGIEWDLRTPTTGHIKCFVVWLPPAP